MNNIFVDADAGRIKNKGPSFGTVDSYSGGRATLVFDGETESDGIEYVCIESCTPSVGDRVFFIRTGNTLLIIGVIS